MSYRVERVKKMKNYSINERLELGNENIRIIINPFSNLLEMVEEYLNIQKHNDLDALKKFVEYDNNDNNSNCDMYDMFFFVTTMYLSSIDPADDDDWIKIEKDKLEYLLKDSFFDEYHRTKSFLKRFCQREYPMLDVYAFAKLQSIAVTSLPREITWGVNTIWTFDDFICNIFSFGWYDIIANVYKTQGIHWFIDNGKNDPILYKWACYAALACRKSNLNDYVKLKQDICDIFKELLIGLTIRNSLNQNKHIIDFVQKCLINFNDEDIICLKNQIVKMEKENKQLIDENKQLNEGMSLLREQISELQKDNQRSNYDRFESIAHKLYCLSPQTSDFNKKVENFEKIWEKLSESTRKDIKLSISMFETFQSYDLALFPMIRSLENEFARNFFLPFYNSQSYKNIKCLICNNKKYEKTHIALIKRSRFHPTMGNIPFIGKAMNDIKALEASDVIKAFRQFLGKNCKSFVSICKLLDNYSFGVQRYKLVDVRNGIAHGDNNITENIDKKCYEEISRLLYEPPMQILFELIKYSMNKANI